MFSLDVARWRDKQQQQNQHGTKPMPPRELRRSCPSLADERHEETAMALRGRDDDDGAALPNVHTQDAQAKRDRRLKKLYGRTQKEMHDAYVERVGQWMQTAPTKTWAKDYAKHTSYSKQYVPRERTKTKEIGGPMLKTNLYSPRGVFKGGGECVKSLIDGDPSAPQEEREEYREAIRFIEKTREKDKEIHPPMSVPKNKSLECAHYFVEDVICAPQPQSLSRPTSRTQLLPIGADGAVDHHHFDPPPTTAEYVSHPQWRQHSPDRWMSRAFVTTVSSTNAHTAQNRSITGTHYAQSVLTSEAFVPVHKRMPVSPQDAALNPRDHERRAQTAAAALRDARSPQRPDRKYFSSMWTQPGSPSRAAAVPVEVSVGGDATSSLPPPTRSSTTNANAGRTLAIQLRERASQGIASPRRARAKAFARSPVVVRPLGGTGSS